jgi:hypothetical protein
MNSLTGGNDQPSIQHPHSPVRFRSAGGDRRVFVNSEFTVLGKPSHAPKTDDQLVQRFDLSPAERTDAIGGPNTPPGLRQSLAAVCYHSLPTKAHNRGLQGPPVAGHLSRGRHLCLAVVAWAVSENAGSPLPEVGAPSDRDLREIGAVGVAPTLDLQRGRRENRYTPIGS